MVVASGRWLGVRLDLLASMLIGAVSLAAVLVSQDAGKYIFRPHEIRSASNPLNSSLQFTVKLR